MLTKVTYVTLFVNDQDKTLDFYTHILGFEKRIESPVPGGGRFLTVGLKGQETSGYPLARDARERAASARPHPWRVHH